MSAKNQFHEFYEGIVSLEKQYGADAIIRYIHENMTSETQELMEQYKEYSKDLTEEEKADIKKTLKLLKII